MIKGIDIKKIYGADTVLDDISLQIEPGKVTSIVGPNGAGKSTLLGIISRLISASAGSVFVDEKEIGVWVPRELAKKLSILKQSNSLNVRMTVRELVSFGRFPYGEGRLSSQDWQHVDQAISHVGLTEIQEKQLAHLSGGQRQRAFVAMVIAQDTEYILLDEPLNSLDMKHSVEMMTILHSLAKDLNKAVVVVLHDINFASFYSDTIIALKKGHLACQGTVDEIIREDVLTDIFEIPIRIETFGEKKLCVYF